MTNRRIPRTTVMRDPNWVPDPTIPDYTNGCIKLGIVFFVAFIVYNAPSWYRWYRDYPQTTPFEDDCNDVAHYWMTWLKENTETYRVAKRYNQNAAAILKENDDPTLLFYGDLIIYAGVTIGLLIIIIGGTKLIVLLMNYKLIVLNNMLLTRVNFFRQAIVNRLNYIKKNNLVDYNQNFYEIMIKRIDEFSKTEFWNFDTDEQFREIRNDFAGFQLALSDSNDFLLYYDITVLIRAFYKKVEVKRLKIEAAAKRKADADAAAALKKKKK